MTSYNNGKIYKIISDNTDKVYIGSTTIPLIKRFIVHKSAFNRYKLGLVGYCSSVKIFEYGDCSIKLIKDFPCNSKKELEIEEHNIIDLDNEKAVNSRGTSGLNGLTKAEYMKEYVKRKEGIYINCRCGMRYKARDKYKHPKSVYHLDRCGRDDEKNKIIKKIDNLESRIEDLKKIIEEEKNKWKDISCKKIIKDDLITDEERVDGYKICICGCKIKKMWQHRQSAKHKKRMAELENN